MGTKTNKRKCVGVRPTHISLPKGKSLFPILLPGLEPLFH